MSKQQDHTENDQDMVRGIPANVEAERAVLGALLIDPDAIVKVADVLRPEDFFRERHAWLYEAMRALNERSEPLDFVTLVNELERRGNLVDIGGPAYLTSLIASTPTALYVDHYAGIVMEAATRRRLISAAGRVVQLAYDESGSVDDALDQAEQAILSVGENRITNDFQPVNGIMSKVVAHIDYLSRNKGKIMGVPTGYKMLDLMLGGLQETDLIIIAGRPGMGKSSISLGIGYNAAKYSGLNVGYISLEMSNEQLTQRLLSMATGVDSHRLRIGDVHDEEWPAIIDAANAISAMGIYIEDTPAATMMDLRTKCRRLHNDHKLDLIIVDYLQLIAGSGIQRHLELSQITKGLKALARELHVPVVALSQLNRSLESRIDKRPMLSDLRESGAIEEDADVVMFIYREDYYNEETDRQNIADIIIAKHRHGSTGTVSLFFKKEQTLFHDLELKRTEL